MPHNKEIPAGMTVFHVASISWVTAGYRNGDFYEHKLRTV
jgi:hypothetical protein